jgi:hypothetical protein
MGFGSTVQPKVPSWEAKSGEEVGGESLGLHPTGAAQCLLWSCCSQLRPPSRPLTSISASRKATWEPGAETGPRWLPSKED